MIAEPLQLIVNTAYGKWVQDFGESEKDVREKEIEIGATLPEPMREFYKTVGRHPEIMDVNYHFTPVKSLKIEDEMMTFCAENQWTAFWAIKRDQLAIPNPPVVAKSINMKKWYTEALKVSSFLLNTACWQAIMSLTEVARCELIEKDVPKLEKHFEYIGDRKVRSGFSKLSFIDRENRILLCYVRTAAMLYVGSSSNEALEHFEKESGFDLEWL